MEGGGWEEDRSLPATRHAPPATRYIIGRDRDRPALERLGRVEVLARGPAVRFDRTYTMFRITPERAMLDRAPPVADIGKPGVQR